MAAPSIRMERKMKQRSEEWLEARKGRITASAVGAILGNSPHQSRDDVMRRMVREYHGADQEFTGNIATEYGVANEPGALAQFEIETGFSVDAVGFIAREDWAGCSPDGLIGGSYGLEIKCPFGMRKDEVPVFRKLRDQPHYRDQVQFSLWVTERNEWYFYQWSPFGSAIEVEEVSEEWQAENIPKLRQFYAEYLHERERPDEYLSPKRVIVDTLEAHRIVREYDELGAAIDNATERRKELLAEMTRLSGKQDALFAGRKLTLVERKGTVSYAKALAEYAPDADLEPFRGKPSSSWRLS